MAANISSTEGGPGYTELPAASDDLVDGIDLEAFRADAEKAFTSVLEKATAELSIGNDLLKAFASAVAFLITQATRVLLKAEQTILPDIQPVLEAIVKGVTDLILPVGGLAGELSSIFCAMIAGSIGKGTGQDAEKGGPTAGVAGQYAYDQIVAPLAGITGATDPTSPGAGEANIQRTLGSIVQVHLVTWVINVLANITELGTLKFFNSFSEVILSALNVRGMSRLCMRPYMDAMITKPATHELNTKFPLNFTSESSIVKAYLRGAYTPDEYRAKMRAEGYDDTWATQALLDAAKELTVSEVVYLVRSGSWDQQDAIQYLVSHGWDNKAAPVALFQELNALVFEQQRAEADALGSHVANRELDPDLYVDILMKMGFTQNEATAYRARYACELEFTRPLTLTQVQDLYKESLVDLDFVRRWLAQNGNSADDSDLLVLLYFTAADQRVARKASLGAQARVASERAKEQATKYTQLQDAALAKAYAELAKKKADLAASLGE